MLGDFTVKNGKLEREIYIQLKIDKVETKCAVLQIIIIICVPGYVSHVCKRIFKIQALIKQLLTKYQIFTILPQISHFHKYRNFSSIFATF